MAIPIPADVAAMQVIVAVNQPAADLLAITQRYSDQNVFLCMLSCIGCDVKERFRFLHDGFNTMESLVEHFNDDIDAFKKHLTNSNKTWLNHTYWNGVANKNINYNNATTDSIYNNFQSGYMKGNLQAIFTFSQLPIFNNQSKFDGFILGGIGLMRFQTSINALDTAQNIYNFRVIEDLPSET